MGFFENKIVTPFKEFWGNNQTIGEFKGTYSNISFIIMILIIFYILVKLMASIVNLVKQPSSNVILLPGMINSKHTMHITQNPNIKSSIPIIRSKNKEEGLEFTWSVWINISDLIYKENEYKNIFHKGELNISTKPHTFGLNTPLNGPGLYIGPVKNQLVVIMNTFENLNEEIIINDIPLNKWINVIITVYEQKKLDVYINGNLTRRHILSSLPKQNYGDVYISANGGFSGYTSKLEYWAKTLSINNIQSIVYSGPNLKAINNNNDLYNVPKYLSIRWFFDDDYNLN